MRGGLAKYAGRPDFEQSDRLSWEREYDYDYDYEDENGEGTAVERHAECVGRWLAHQGFVPRRPLRLLAVPKGQDQWTTYVEYLAFEAESLHVLAEAARKLEKRAKHATVTRGNIAQSKLRVDQQRFRVDWVLSEIEKIEAELKAAAGESGGGKSGRSRRRRRTDEASGPREDMVGPRLRKPRRTKNAEETDKMDETQKIPAEKSDSISQTRRSKRRKPSTEADVKEGENDRELQSKRSKIVSRSDGPSSIPQPRPSDHEASAVSAVVTTSKTMLSRRRRSKRITTPCKTVPVASDPREERLKSLRPRVNGKVTTVSTDSRRYKRGEKVWRSSTTRCYCCCTEHILVSREWKP